MTSIKADQITFPIETIHATLKVHGIYAIPDEWKTTDDANPGLFTYAVRMSKFQIFKGKICPRQLTEKEKKQQQQKSKKGGKKDSKNPQPNEEQEKLKKLQEQRQRQREQLFAKLSQQQQFYYNAEDIYRSSFLKFEQNNAEASFNGNDCVIFQERLLKDKGDWIYIYKMPTASEEQLAKMKKSKPKTLANINDLNPVIMRAWVSFEELSNSKENIQIKQLRCKIHQVDRTPETPQPKLQRTYIKLTFTLKQPIIKQKDSYSAASLINDPQKPKQKSAQTKCLQELKQQLGLAIQSLAMQFSTMFWKQLNVQQLQRSNQVFLNKKSDLTKRKQQFLYDFNVTGKYKILKDRIKKCIVHVCQTKYKEFFTGMKSFNGIKCNNQDQIYSQIYNLLVQSYQDTLFKIIHQKQQTLGEVLVVNNETIKQQKENILSTYKAESVTQRVKRTIKEYEMIQDHFYGEKVIRKYIQEYPQIIELKYFYGTYCLKYNIKPAREVLPFIEEYLTQQKHTLTDDKKIQFMIILFNIGGENYTKGWIILREVIEKQIRQSNNKPIASLSKWLLLASVILKNMNAQKLSIKYRALALREYQRFVLHDTAANSQQGSQVTQSNHKQTPSKSQIPSLNSVANYTEVTTNQIINKLYDSLIEFLGNYSSFELVKKIAAQKSQTEVGETQGDDISLTKALPEINELLVSHSSQSRAKLLNLTLMLYEKATSTGSSQEKNKILQLVIRAQLQEIQASKSIEHLKALQGYLKKSLMTNSNPQSRFIILLRLGYLYTQKEEYGNARACLLKYLQKSAEYPSFLSGLSYKLLGISCLKLQRINDAIQNFKHWNLSDTQNRGSWLYLALGHAHSQQLITVNQCLTQFKKRSQKDPNTQEETQSYPIQDKKGNIKKFWSQKFVLFWLECLFFIWNLLNTLFIYQVKQQQLILKL